MTGLWTIGTLPNGASTTLTITANVPGAGTFVNLAKKTGETELDPNTGNDQATAVVVAGGGGPPLADLSIQKTDSPDPVRAGQQLTYTLLVTNQGPSSASNVTVMDTLPAGVTLVSASSSQGGCAGTTTLTCMLGGLAAGNNATVSVVVNVGAAAVRRSRTRPQFPQPRRTRTAPTTPRRLRRRFSPPPTWRSLKTVSNPAPLVSQTFTFTVTAANNGPSTANGVVVTDLLPANLTFISAAPSQGTYAAGSGLWTVGSLANGSSGTLVLTVLAAAPGAFTNTATKTAEIEIDPDPSNDSAMAGGGVGIVADLTILKLHLPPTFFRGSSGAFSLTVSNLGTGPSAGLVTVTDSLPPASLRRPHPARAGPAR